MKQLLSYARAHFTALALALALVANPALALATTHEGPQPGPLPERTEAAASEESADAQSTPAAPAEAEPLAPQTITAATAPRYFLPNLGQATTSKIQKPWGACWAFAVASAIESSILKAEAKAAGADQAQLLPDSPAFAALNLTGLPLTPDISERAIAWFAHEPQTEHSGGPQAGEGFALLNDSPEEQLSGGNFATAVSALTAWQALVTEDAAPYEYNGYVPGQSTPWFTSDEGSDTRYEDWGLPDEVRTAEDTGWRIGEVLRLQSPATVSETAEYIGYNAEATTAIKKTLVEVGGVAVALSMEQNIPADVWQGNYTDAEPLEDLTFSTWSQYDNATSVTQNHAAVILGWDDGYPAENFQGTASGQPPANGAWLCKNSWGNDALFEALGDGSAATRWGLTDENGQATGYFWLSYYDHSIADPEAFVVTPVEESYDTLYQHDFVGAAEYVTPVKYSGLVQAANVFTAKSPELIEAVTSWTFAPNTGCVVTVGVLPYGFDVAGASADEVMGASVPLGKASATFEEAGFHSLELDAPVLVVEGQAFTITVEIAAAEGALDEATGSLAEDADSYLGVEVSYLDAGASGQTTSANAIANPGETFVCVDGSHWEGIAQFNEERVDVRNAYGKELDFVYGNAVVKGLANRTTMADPAHVYQMMELTPVQR